jgi:hypothetical protein
MATYAGGTAVARGYFIQGRSFEFANVEKDGGQLPGSAETRWVRVPTLLVIAMAPALGGLFVMTLPFVGFGLVAYEVARRLAPGAKAGAKELAATVAPVWVPGEAHLAGTPTQGKDEEAPPRRDEKVEALAKEIEEKRAPRG